MTRSTADHLDAAKGEAAPVNMPSTRAKPDWTLASGASYILTNDDLENGRNRLGIDVRHIPLGVPLCGYCDAPLSAAGKCAPCQTIHTDFAEQLVDVEHIRPGQVAA